MSVPASIVIPTRARPDYLRVALASIAPQAAAAGADVVVVDDAGPSAQIEALSARFGARYEPHPAPLGLNVARNTGVERSHGELVVFVDDDVDARPGWLDALLRAARQHPRTAVFTGPIRPRLDGRPPRSCGREGPPITALDLGPHDTDARYAWGANMAVRRRALERVGPFDVSLRDGGDEQEWQERLRAHDPDATVLYVADAAVAHRRAGPDARLASLARAAHARGRAARRFDVRRGHAPSLAAELRTLAGCLWHVVRRRCPAGLVTAAHSAGRLGEGLREHRARALGPSSRLDDGADRTNGAGPSPPESGADDFLSGASGTVGGIDALRREVQDRVVDTWELASGRRLRLRLAASHAPHRMRVLVLGVERPERRPLASAIRAELLRSRHHVELHMEPPGQRGSQGGGSGERESGQRGKFENLNAMLEQHPVEDRDWLLVIDDDVTLPRGFLDNLLYLADRFALDLAQPAHRLASHAAWHVTRRRPGSVARQTSFVEIGPVTAFARSTFDTLLPFPALRMGWGLDLHWAALARQHGWRCGVLDAVAVGHRAAPAADAYSRDAAVGEARAFLAERPYVTAADAQRTLTAYRRLPSHSLAARHDPTAHRRL